MSRYCIEEVTRDGTPLVRLRDQAGGAFADILVQFGNNCLAAHLPAPDGRLVESLLEPARLQDLYEQPSWYGIPLLFSWPSAIPGGQYEYRGQTYQLPVAPPTNSASHGFVKSKPWKLVRTAASDTGAALVSVFDSADHPETLEGYPFPYHVEAEYRLESDRLRLRFSVQNPGDSSLPFGYGAHPYFKLPLGPHGARADCLACVPAERRWDGQRLRQIRQGPVPTWDELAPRVSGDHDLRQPRPLAERLYDGVYTDLSLVDGMVECFVRDPVNGLEAVMRATPNHTNVVVYTPRQHSAVCFEPWTCPPNAFNLAARGVSQSGLIELAPGERWEGSMWLFLRRSGE